MASPSRVRPLGLLSRRVMVPCVFCGRDRAANEIRLLSERHTSPLGSAEAKPREQACAGRPQWLSKLVRKPQQRCAGARRSIGPPATASFKRAKIAFG